MAFHKTLKPKVEDFRRLTVTDSRKEKRRAYALYIPKSSQGKKHLIYLPNILVQCSDDVDALWITVADKQNGKPVKPKKGYVLSHHYTAFLEDMMHDWDIRNDDKGNPYLSYYGSGTKGDIWLILVIKEQSNA